MDFSIEAGANVYFNKTPISKVYNEDNLLWTDADKPADTQYITPTPPEPTTPEKVYIYRITISKIRNDSIGFVAFSEIRFYDSNQDLIDFSDYISISTNAAVYAGHKEETIFDNNFESYFKADFDPLTPIEIIVIYDTAKTTPQYFSIVTSEDSYDYDPINVKVEYEYELSPDINNYSTLFNLVSLNLPKKRNKNSDLYDNNYVPPAPIPEGYIPMYDSNWNLFTSGTSTKSEWVENPDGIHLGSSGISYTKVEDIDNKTFINAFINSNGELVTAEDVEQSDTDSLALISSTITDTTKYTARADNLTIATKINTNLNKTLKISYYFYDAYNNYIPTITGLNNSTFITTFINDYSNTTPIVSIPVNAAYYQISIRAYDGNNATITADDIFECNIYYGYNQNYFYMEDTNVFVQGNLFDETDTKTIYNVYKADLLSNLSIDSIRCDATTDLATELKYKIYLFDKNGNYLAELIDANSLDVWTDISSVISIADENYTAKYISIAITTEDNIDITPSDINSYRIVFKYTETYAKANDKSIAYLETKNSYDMTEISNLVLSLNSTGNNNATTAIYLAKNDIYSTNDRKYNYDIQKIVNNNIDTITNVNIDVKSLKGNYYIGIANFYGNDFTFYSVTKTDMVHEVNSSLRFTISALRDSESTNVSFNKLKFYDVRKNQITLPECFSVSSSDTNISDTDIENLINDDTTSFTNSFSSTLTFTFNFETIIPEPYYMTITTSNDSIDNDIVSFILEYSSNKGISYDTIMSLFNVEMTEDRETDSLYYYVGYFKPAPTPPPGPDDPPVPPEPVVVPGWLTFNNSNWNLFNTDKTGLLCDSEITYDYKLYLKNIEYKHQSQQSVTSFEQGDFDINGSKYSSDAYVRTTNYIKIPESSLTYSINSVDTNNVDLVNTVCFYDTTKNIIKSELCGITNDTKNYSVLSGTSLIIPKEASYLRYSVKYLNNSNIDPTDIASSTINWNSNANRYKEVDLKQLDWFLSAIDLVTGKVKINDTSSERYLSLWNYVEVPANAKRVCVELKSTQSNNNVKWFLYCYDSNLNYMYSDSCSNYVDNNTYMNLPELDDLKYIAVVSNYTITQEFLNYARLTFELSEPDIHEFYANYCYAETKNKIDLSTVGKINADIDTILPNSYIYVSKYAMNDDPNVFMPYRAMAIEANGDTIVSLDVNNLYESYYIGFAAYNNSEITIKAIDKSEKVIETDVEPVNVNRYLDLMQFNRDWRIGEYVEDGVFTINSSGTCLMCDYLVPVINSNIVIGALYENTSTNPHTTRKLVSKLCYYDINKRYFSDTDWSADWDSDYNYERYIAPDGVAYYKVLLKYIDENPATTSYLDCKIYFDSDINFDNLYVYTGVYAIECKDNVSYIDTGIKPGFDKEIELKFTNLKWNSKFIIGAIDNWPSSNSDSAFLITNNTSTEPNDHLLDIDCYFHPSSSYSNPIAIDDIITNNEEFILRITFEPNSDPIKNYNMCIYINNNTTPIVTEAISDSDIDFSTLSNITLFNYLSSTTNPASVLTTNAGDYQLRSLIVRDIEHNNVKIMECIPILDYRQEPCLFDLVNRQYIYNANLSGQGFDVVDTPLPAELRMPDYTDIKGIYHLQSFVLGDWRNTLNTSDQSTNHWLDDITFVGNVFNSNDAVTIYPNDYAVIDYNSNDFNTEFSFYIIAKLGDTATKYSHKNLFNTNLIKQSSYFNSERTSYDLAFTLEPNTYYVLSCNIPLDNNSKATITIGQDNCYTSNPITVLTDSSGELIVTLNETEYYTTGAELVTITNGERVVNYQMQLEKGENQTASDTPTTYEPFILPDVNNGTILSTLTENGGFELGITDRSIYNKPNLLTLRNSNGNSVMCGLTYGGIDPTEYHLYTIVGKTENNVSALDLYVDGILLTSGFSYIIDSNNTDINVCRTIDSNGDYVCSDHMTYIKFMAFGTTAHTNNQIHSNVSDTGNLITMYNISAYTIPEYTITELFISNFVNKKITCTNGVEVITDSENYYSTATALTIPPNTKTITIKNVFGADKINLPHYILIYDSLNNIIDTTDGYKANQEICLLPDSNATYMKFVLSKGVMAGSLLYADVIWNKDNKKYNIVDITTWESGTISTVNGTILPSNSIIRTGFIEIPDRVDSVLFEGVTKNSEPLQYTIFAYDDSYNYVNTYNNLITNNFEWKDNDVITDLLFNTQKNISYIKVIAQKSDADITANNVLHTKLAFMSRNSVAELTTSKWEQYDETNFGEPTITTVTNLNSLYYDEYIDITNSKYIVLNTTLKGSKASDEIRYAIYFYNDNKEHISVNDYVSYWLGDMNIINVSGTIFANAKYIRVLLKDNTDNITVSDIDTSYITIVKNNVANDITQSEEEYYAELNERVVLLETDNTSNNNRLDDVEDDVSDLVTGITILNGQIKTVSDDLEYLVTEPIYIMS